MNERCLRFREKLSQKGKVHLKCDNINDYPHEYEKGYYTYVDSQKNKFEDIIILINDIISVLKREGVISEKSQIKARIKSFSSAQKNHLNGRNLKDIFGIEIIGATESEKIYLSKLINKMITRKKGKQR